MLRVRVLVALALAAIVIVIVFADAGAPRGCKEADRLVSQRQYAAARSNYLKDLADDSTAGCAARGLRVANVNECRRAAFLEAAGEASTATKLMDEVATSEPAESATLHSSGAVVDCTRLAPTAACSSLTSLVTTSHLTQAAAYDLLLAHGKTAQCAQRELKPIVTSQCSLAETYFSAKDNDDARKIYLAVLSEANSASSISACAVSGLGELPSSSSSSGTSAQ